jgi:hypothetical protein
MLLFEKMLSGGDEERKKELNYLSPGALHSVDTSLRKLNFLYFLLNNFFVSLCSLDFFLCVRRNQDLKTLDQCHKNEILLLQPSCETLQKQQLDRVYV